MDLVDWSEDVFRRIREAYRALADTLGIDDFHIVPLSALKGDNVVERSSHTPWYDGLPLLSLLESLPVGAPGPHRPPRFFVQWVIRHGADGFRGYAGQLAGGGLAVGEAITVLPSGVTGSEERRVGKGGVSRC